MTELTEKIINEFDANYKKIEKFTGNVELLIKEILEAKNIKVHLVVSRTKNRSSFLKKVSNPNKTYQKLTDITDIVGIRVITYFEDEIDDIAKIIEKEFQIDLSKSIDKRKKHSSDSFGYLSLHYICSLSKKRKSLSEYKNLIDLPFEIQIRSILQHSWAEIEHDMGYKNYISPTIKRSFSRIASLLEMSDNEFVRIRDHIASITNNSKDQLLSIETLNDFIKKENIIKKIDKQIVKKNRNIKNLSIKLNCEDFRKFNGKTIEGLNYIEIFTIKNLKKALLIHEKDIPAFFRSFVDFTSIYGNNLAKGINFSLSIGYGIFLLPYVKILKSTDSDFIKFHHLTELFKIDNKNPFEKHLEYDRLEIERSAMRSADHMLKSYKKFSK